MYKETDSRYLGSKEEREWAEGKAEEDKIADVVKKEGDRRRKWTRGSRNRKKGGGMNHR